MTISLNHFKPYFIGAYCSVLKRSARAKDYEEQTTIVCGDLTLDIARGVIYRKTADNRENAQAELTKNELKILHCLLLHKGQIVSRMDLIEYLWDQQVFLDDNALSVNMTRIRGKLKEIGLPQDYIKTKRGMGYYI